MLDVAILSPHSPFQGIAPLTKSGVSIAFLPREVNGGIGKIDETEHQNRLLQNDFVCGLMCHCSTGQKGLPPISETPRPTRAVGASWAAVLWGLAVMGSPSHIWFYEIVERIGTIAQLHVKAFA